MSDTDWRERALKAEADLAAVEAGLGELRALLSQNHADAISGIKELRELAQRLRQDLASVTAQRDAAVAALRKADRISLPPQRLDDVVFLRETFFSLKSLIAAALSSLDKEGADNA